MAVNAVERKVYHNGRVSIPKDIKEMFKIEKGSKVKFSVDTNREEIIIKPAAEKRGEE